MKLFYIHTPKTGGTSINNFFAKKFKKSLFHIEGLDEKEILKVLRDNEFVSGHVSYSKIKKYLSPDTIKIITFREPFSFVISHLSWVRKLADPDQKERFLQHPKIFQDIAMEMTKYDFSNPKEINRFIDWLEKVNFYYFHDTQTIYLDFKKNLQNAKNLLNEIEFVGIMESMKKFLETIDYELNMNIINKFGIPKENINKNKYGFDINDKKTKEVLNRLITKDIIIYETAKKRMEEMFNKYNIAVKKENIIGWVDEIKPSFIKGWAKDKESNRHLEVALISNNKILTTGKADKYRKNLKIKKIHFTGCCEYEFNNLDFTKINIDSLKVIELTTKKELPLTDNAKKDLDSLKNLIKTL